MPSGVRVSGKDLDCIKIGGFWVSVVSGWFVTYTALVYFAWLLMLTKAKNQRGFLGQSQSIKNYFQKQLKISRGFHVGVTLRGALSTKCSWS